ncbi:calcium/sodium antiporter [Alteraurantiacibacter aquimixticola]|uniref:Calcium/sodium antiporter n=1 Tax=Alteraurantiacibacter aquimixticola TaxID=2489173 RepID=A0A4T3F821_9SPHN|nr:calcium/sodium antiporter [Alteraurantiacibacter aquimixticola]TIX51892.1 calcium/sodium antiporter [Alteraurantiacibacter aquimixticola]
MTDILLLLAGFVMLLVGGDVLVRGAVRLSELLGLSPLLVGLVIVGLGTSLPELATSVQAAMRGSPGIALGNIVGSNMANALLVLGAVALIRPIEVERNILWRDGGVGLLCTVILFAAAMTLGLDRLFGHLLIAVLAIYLWRAYRMESGVGELAADHGAAYDRALAAEDLDPALIPSDEPSVTYAKAVALLVAGLAIVVGGGVVLVDAAIAIATDYGISESVIGLTIVAFGTSAPELATSVIAAIRGKSDIALGNVLGSNIYNIALIGGLTGLAAPGPVPEKILLLDLPLLLAATIALLVFAYSGMRLNRWEGTALVAGYGGYILWTAALV